MFGRQAFRLPPGRAGRDGDLWTGRPAERPVRTPDRPLGHTLELAAFHPKGQKNLLGQFLIRYKDFDPCYYYSRKYRSGIKIQRECGRMDLARRVSSQIGSIYHVIQSVVSKEPAKSCLMASCNHCLLIGSMVSATSRSGSDTPPRPVGAPRREDTVPMRCTARHHGQGQSARQGSG